MAALVIRSFEYGERVALLVQKPRATRDCARGRAVFVRSPTPGSTGQRIVLDSVGADGYDTSAPAEGRPRVIYGIAARKRV